jgi:cytochrome c oxidase cbb3-type subunit 2
MALSIHTNHRLLFGLAAGIYLVLVGLCAIWPATVAQRAEAEVAKPLENEFVSRGRRVYASLNCVTCHTQQIRGDARLAREVDGRLEIPVLAPDARFGREAASRSVEYAWQEPPFMGTERIGPDLLSVGKRLPASQWHYWHLYDPRAVVPDSLMPPHRFLFTTQRPPEEVRNDYEQVQVIEGLGVEGELWATPAARDLVEYLLSLTRERLDRLEGGPQGSAEGGREG